MRGSPWKGTPQRLINLFNIPFRKKNTTSVRL